MSEKQKDIIIDESSLDPKDEKNQPTQSEGYEHLRKFLFDTLEDNKDAVSKQYDKDCCVIKDDNFQRTHNSIFINGKRGSGKTQFLLSIEKYITTLTEKKYEENSRKFYFFKPIDPTLLHDNENFLTIIVAMILNNLENNCHLNELSKDKKKEFYTLLNDVSKAIDGLINCTCVDGNSLETIAQDQSSLKLERYMNRFFEFVLEVVKKEKLVILIDDIDMALDKGFEVLEVVRKYLSSSHIIPIVTGDIDLYTSVIEKGFFSKFPYKEDDRLRYSHIGSGFLQTLSTDYLIKVLPMHRRIKLKTFWELAEDRNIIFEFNNERIIFTRKYIVCDEEENTNKVINYDEQKFSIDNRFEDNFEFFQCTIKKNLFTRSARSIIQIFKREMNDDFKNFLTNIESLERIKKEYSYEILSKVEMVNIYKEKALEKLYLFEYDDAKKLFNNAKDIDNTDYNIHAFLGVVYYELATDNDNEELYNKSINAYKESYKLLKINIDNEEDDDTWDLILPKLANSYLELFELYLINEKYDLYIKLSRDFKKYFNRKRNVLKVFYMFEILNDIVNKNRKRESALFANKKERWNHRYKRYHYNWDFEKLYNWVQHKEMDTDVKIFLLHQLEYFEDNL